MRIHLAKVLPPIRRHLAKAAVDRRLPSIGFQRALLPALDLLANNSLAVPLGFRAAANRERLAENRQESSLLPKTLPVLALSLIHI